MTREELLQFIEKTNLLVNLPDSAKREEILDAIAHAPQDKLPEVEQVVKKLYEDQKELSEATDKMLSEAKMLEQKMQKLVNKNEEEKENKKEKEDSGEMLNKL